MRPTTGRQQRDCHAVGLHGHQAPLSYPRSLFSSGGSATRNQSESHHCIVPSDHDSHITIRLQFEISDKRYSQTTSSQWKANRTKTNNKADKAGIKCIRSQEIVIDRGGPRCSAIHTAHKSAQHQQAKLQLEPGYMV